MPRDMFASNLVYILFVVSLDNLSPKFFEVYKRKEKTSSFGCGYYIVYVAQSQERKTTAREMLM